MGRRTPRSFKEQMGKKLWQARMMAGLSQIQMAGLLGFNSIGAIQHYERGRFEIYASDLWKVAKITGHSIEWFYQETTT